MPLAPQSYTRRVLSLCALCLLVVAGFIFLSGRNPSSQVTQYLIAGSLHAVNADSVVVRGRVFANGRSLNSRDEVEDVVVSLSPRSVIERMTFSFPAESGVAFRPDDMPKTISRVGITDMAQDKAVAVHGIGVEIRVSNKGVGVGGQRWEAQEIKYRFPKP